jgi:hypothetical protein
LGGNGGITVGGGGGYRGNGGNNTGGGGGFDTNGENSAGAGGGQGGTLGHGGGAGSPGNGGGGGGSLLTPGGNASTTNGGDGGRFGGGGASQSGNAGNGGEFGGGGAGANRGGNGGFGGGGGLGYTVGGNGGFGAGGGGSGTAPAYGLGGAFGGNAGTGAPLGGGGAALGGHVFVRGGATLTLNDPSLDSGTVTAGAAGTTPSLATSASPGQAAGSALFLSGTTVLSISAGEFNLLTGTIADASPYLGTSTATGFSAGQLVKTGAGTLELNKRNTYGGGTILSQGMLVIDDSQSLGIGPVTLNDASTGTNGVKLQLNSIDFGQPIIVAPHTAGTTTLSTLAQSDSSFSLLGSLMLNGNLTFIAQGAYPQDPAHNTPQTNISSTISGSGDLTITGGHLVQFAGGAHTQTGRTIVTGNTTLSIDNSLTSPANSVIQIDAGSSLVLEAIADGATIAGLTGAGTVSNNANRGSSSVLNLVNTIGGVHTFTGTVSGRVAILESGNDTFEIAAQNNTSASLRVTAGTIRLLGDQQLSSFEVQKADPGKQTVDLNGHSVRVIGATLAMAGLYNRLRTVIGDSSDGIYDSTATTHDAIGYQYPAPGGGVLIKLTLKGDANLDGIVNFADLVTVAQNYGKTGVYWDTGDFDYDNTVGFSDLVAVAQNYGQSFPAAPIPGATPNFNADLAAAFASVPEPSSIIELGIIPTAFLVRRHRRKRV